MSLCKSTALLTLILLCQITIICNSESEEQCESTAPTIEYLSPQTPIVILDFDDLKNKIDLSNSIETAYGPTGTGILLIKNVPELSTKRNRLLHISRQVAHLDDNIKKSLEDAESLYSIGYSHGKEMLSKNKPDLRKMSYYGNPMSNDVTNGNNDLILNYRSVYGRNIWPNKHLPLLEETFMDLGQLIHSVGQLVAHQLDAYVSTKRDGYKSGLFKQMIGTNIPKARLLYYFSDNEMNELYGEEENNNENRIDNWCGWHNDHSALTGLILGMYFDKNGNIIEDIGNYASDNENGNGNGNGMSGGLYIKTRENITYHIELNEYDSDKYLAFQIGETSQIMSGGSLIATPHAVMAYRNNEKYFDVSRASFAVFHQPHYDFSMIAPYHDGITLNEIQFDRFLPDSVPLLSSRWWNASDDTFGEFTKRTFQTYYNMKML
eukprot:207957_1